MIMLSPNPSEEEISDFWLDVNGCISMGTLIPCDPLYSHPLSKNGSLADAMLDSISTLSALRHPNLEDVKALGWIPLVYGPPREYPGLAYYKVKHVETGEVKIACLREGAVPPMLEFLNSVRILY